jgi:1-acyl-sn-glycerol-3-phosphate acyltransferase
MQFASSRPSSASHGAPTPSRLPWRDRAALRLQLGIARASALLWVPLTVALMRFGLGWRIDGLAEARRSYREIWGDGRAPVLICANHLTLVDSAVIAWALGSPWWFVRRFRSLPWNVPERRNFATSRLQRLLVYLMKCVPITRGSDRKEVAAVLDRLVYLMSQGEAVLIFPEGGRGRSGRIELDNSTYGAGRIATELPGCKVVCVYLRGAGQTTYGDLPARGERFHVRVTGIEPKTAHAGLRGSVEVSRQILTELVDLERSYFDGR